MIITEVINNYFLGPRSGDNLTGNKYFTVWIFLKMTSFECQIFKSFYGVFNTTPLLLVLLAPLPWLLLLMLYAILIFWIFYII